MQELHDFIDVEPKQNFITHHVNLRVVPASENIVSSNFHNWYARAVRAFDIFFSVILLMAFVLCLPFVWIANLLFSRGPLFYKQIRVGKNGKQFKIIKFRSMKTDAESDGVARFAMKNDDRITAVGLFLRKTRIDEIPQVINILRGEMTLIGPRPERPQFVEEFVNREHNYQFRYLVKPGITGWAQIKFGYTSTMDEGIKKLQYDLYFIRNRNFSMDFEILCKTIVTVLSQSGT
jgi:lipopolysaccharide/colanic/teichoic acid biosynthesis glycosyltransferase